MFVSKLLLSKGTQTLLEGSKQVVGNNWNQVEMTDLKAKWLQIFCCKYFLFNFAKSILLQKKFEVRFVR